MGNFVFYIEEHSNLFPILVLFTFLLAPLIFLYFNKYHFGITSFREQDTPWRKILYVCRFAVTLFLVFAFFVSLWGLMTYLNRIDTMTTVPEEDLSQKIERVSKEISDIQAELESRIEIVKALNKNAEMAENLISLTSDQVNAIQSQLNQELAASDEKGFRTSVVFFALGVVVPLIIQFIVNKKKNFAKKDSYSAEEVHQIVNQVANQVADQVAERLKEDDHTT